MPFGTTVQAQTGKPNSTLTKYSTRPLASNYNALSATSKISPTVTPRTNVTPTSPGLSAGGGRGSNVPMAGMQSQVANPIFQPMISGNNFADKSDQAYNVLSRINETNDILSSGANDQLALANTLIRRRNAQRQAQGQYDQGFNAGGGNQSQGYVTGDPGSFGQGSVKGLSNEQMTNARMIADIGRKRGLNDNAIQIAIMTSLTESGLRNLTYGDRDSQGLFQQRPSQGWGTVQQVTSPNYSINKFYESLQRTNWQGMTPWAAAQTVQRSFDPTGNNYRVQYGIAQQAFRAINRPGVASVGAGYKGNAASGFISAYNNKYIDYDGAFGNQCVDLYNYYTSKFVGGTNIMVGWAPEIYNAYDTKAYARTGANVPGAMGYVAIFRPGGTTPSGHVAIVVGDNGNGTLRVLQSNATPAGSRGNTIISNISKASLMGYLIPRKLMR